MARRGLKSRVHLQEGMRQEVCYVRTGGRRGQWSTSERSSGGRRMSGQGWLKGWLGCRGKPSKTEALSDEGRSVQAGGGSRLLRNARGGGRERRRARERGFLLFLVVVDKVAAHPVRAKAYAVKRATWLGFVFWMSVQISQLVRPVGKLALPAILAQAAFSERSAQFSLIA